MAHTQRNDATHTLRIRDFAGMSRMQRLALVCLARTLTTEEVARLRVSCVC